MTDERLHSTLERLDADGLISADPGIVKMLTGHSYDIETGPSVFALPAIVVASRGGGTVLVCSADEAEASDTTITYEGFTVNPIRRIASARHSVQAAIERAARHQRAVGGRRGLGAGRRSAQRAIQHPGRRGARRPDRDQDRG